MYLLYTKYKILHIAATNNIFRNSKLTADKTFYQNKVRRMHFFILLNNLSNFKVLYYWLLNQIKKPKKLTSHIKNEMHNKLSIRSKQIPNLCVMTITVGTIRYSPGQWYSKSLRRGVLLLNVTFLHDIANHHIESGFQSEILI